VAQEPPSWYDTHATELAVTYESIQAASLHGWMEDLLPAAPALAADIGAGTGRDAAWLVSRGMDVVAVEPSSMMRDQAANLHAEAKVRWLADSLPDLRELLRMGLSFDFILLSAVWMHVPVADRPRAFRKLITLLKPGGMLAMTLRVGPMISRCRSGHLGPDDALNPAQVARACRN
jgi:SAM-dependent methyltransferase